MAAADPRLVGITPAMREGSGMVEFEQRFPQRYYDVGIAEQHAVTFAAGLACEGLKPVVAIYSTFLQRAYDQLIHDVALQNLDVTFRAGSRRPGRRRWRHPRRQLRHRLFALHSQHGGDGAPSDENECRQLLSTAFQYPGPAAVRYPRGAGVGAEIDPALTPLPLGKGQVRRQGQGVAILAFGTVLAPALVAAEQLNATVVDMRFVKPLDVELVLELARSHSALVTVEEGTTQGGAGSAVAEALSAAGHTAATVPLLILGLPDQFIDHGDQAHLLALHGLDADGILASIRQRFGGELRLVVNH